MVLLMISLDSGQNNITPPWAMLVFNLSGVITIFYSNAKIQNNSEKRVKKVPNSSTHRSTCLILRKGLLAEIWFEAIKTPARQTN